MLSFIYQELPHGDFKGKFNLLGLGDIVLPGMFIAMMLRFDAVNASVTKGSFRKPFFSSCLVAYGIGLATVLWMMLFLNMAQVK